MNSAQHTMTVVEDEAILKMVRRPRDKKILLSSQIRKLLKHSTFKGKGEEDVFIESYGDKENGLTVYQSPGKSKDPCVISFCVTRLKSIELEKARKKEARKIKKFVTTTSSAL